MGGKQTTPAPIIVAEDNSQQQQEYKYHPYKVRGFARRSKSGKAINFVIRESDGELHLLTVAKMDIIDAFDQGTQCCIIEYQLSDEEKVELKKNGS
jgi:hypothetical protein